MSDKEKITTSSSYQKFLFANICFALLIFNVSVATPFDIFIANRDEFAILDGIVLLKLCSKYGIYAWAVLNILLLCWGILLKEYVQKWILLLLFVTAVFSWINATFLFGDYGVFDGRGNLNINRFSLISLLQILCFFILCSVALIFRKNFKRLALFCASILCISFTTFVLSVIKLKIDSVILSPFSVKKDFFNSISIDFILSFIIIATIILIAILLICLKKIKRQTFYILSFILCSIIFTGIVFKALNNKNTIVAKERYFTYSATNPNVLMILLDEYQREVFKNTLDDEIKKQLEGFIWYGDTISNSPGTIPSIAAIFTGEIYKKELDMKRFYELSSPKSIAKLFKESGEGEVIYFADLYSKYSEMLFPKNSLVTFPRTTYTPIWYELLINYSIFKNTPDIIKSRVYNNGKWLIRPYIFKPKSKKRLDSLGGAILSFKHIVDARSVVQKDYPKTFKYYRSTLTHAPTILDENCRYQDAFTNTLENKTAEGRCAIKLVIDIVNNLKNAGVFDNTMIIILSDHGFNFVPENFKIYKRLGRDYARASSTLLIKPLGRRGSFTIDDYPAQLSDIPKTIAQAVNIESDDYSGVDLLSDKRDKFRIRIFYNNVYDKYEISGPSDDPKSWRVKARN